MERDRPDSQRNVLLIGSDLMARERIRSAAAHLEMKARAAGVSELVGALQDEPADVLVLDLDEGRDEVLESLRSASKEGLTPNVVIGFYSHVDRDLAAAAQEAGVTPVRRGRFWSNLPGFLGDR
jgi:hypothetical protein